jgi:iron-sulfur cluster repair protein YtfE (RIC family)
MLVELGLKHTGGDVVDALADCHAKIRKFVALARRLADARDDVATAAAQIERYFTQALPRHVADEDEDIAPRLAGRDREIDAALAAGNAEHRAHASHVDRLVAICGELAREPSYPRGELARLAAELDAQLASHLEREERVLFPAIRALPPYEQDAIRAAMRGRRG